RARPTLEVLEARALPSFAAPVSYNVGTQNQFFVPNAAPIDVAAADFNGDGKPDLAVAHTVDDTISVLLNTGTGMFQPAVSVAAAALLTTGAGPFQSGLVSAPLFDYSRWVTAAAFDGDGKLDLAVADGIGHGTQTGTAELTILHGNGNGTFTLGGHYPTPQTG